MKRRGGGRGAGGWREAPVSKLTYEMAPGTERGANGEGGGLPVKENATRKDFSASFPTYQPTQSVYLKCRISSDCPTPRTTDVSRAPGFSFVHLQICSLTTRLRDLFDLHRPCTLGFSSNFNRFLSWEG